MQNLPILPFLSFALAFSLLFVVADWMYKKFELQAEESRKFTHIIGGAMAMALPLFFKDHRHVLLLAIGFLGLLGITFFMGKLDAVHAIKRPSVGSIIFPVPVYLAFWAASEMDSWILFYLPIAILVFCDPLAAWSGRKWGRNPFKIFGGTKTLLGSAAFLIGALILSIWALTYYDLSNVFLYAIMIALAASIMEAISGYGLDNMTIPAVVFVLLYFVVL